MDKPLEEEKRSEHIRQMFNSIASSYDRLNRIISLGLDIRWRKQGIDRLAVYQPRQVLDVATGTGDLAIELLEQIPSIERINATDISEEMMRMGREKVRHLGLEQVIEFSREDCTALSYPDNSFDAVTIGFGIRNFEDIPQAAREIYRVLRPGKPFMILELTEPRNYLLRLGYKLHAGVFIPLVGRMISHHGEAYRYLPRSISRVPQREQMTKIFVEAGFREVSYHSFKPGVCTLYMGIK